MGLMDHRIGDLRHKVNDNSYHVLRFIRTGANSSLQIDNLPPDVIFPKGEYKNSFSVLYCLIPCLVRYEPVKMLFFETCRSEASHAKLNLNA